MDFKKGNLVFEKVYNQYTSLNSKFIMENVLRCRIVFITLNLSSEGLI